MMTSARAVDLREVVLPFWAVRVDAQVRVRPYANLLAADAGEIGGLECGIGACGPAFAVFEVRSTAVQRDGAAGDEAGWLDDYR